MAGVLGGISDRIEKKLQVNTGSSIEQFVSSRKAKQTFPFEPKIFPDKIRYFGWVFGSTIARKRKGTGRELLALDFLINKFTHTDAPILDRFRYDDPGKRFLITLKLDALFFLALFGIPCEPLEIRSSRYFF